MIKASQGALLLEPRQLQLCLALQQVDSVLKVNVGKKTITISIDEKTAVTSDLLIHALKPTGYLATVF